MTAPARSAVALGCGAAACLLLGIADRAPLRLLTLKPGDVLVTLGLAAVAIAGGLLARRALVLLAGVGFLAAAVLLVTQLSLGGTNTLGGDGSTLGLFAAFAVGLLAVGPYIGTSEEDGHGSR